MIELKITMDEKGQVNVTGPVDNGPLCLQMFGLALAAIAQHQAKALAAATLVTATHLPGGNGAQ